MNKPQSDGNENIYVNGAVVAESKPDVIYAQIEANNEGRDTIASSSMNNDNNAVIYSDLEGTGAGNHIVAPSGDVYAQVSR